MPLCMHTCSGAHAHAHLHMLASSWHQISELFIPHFVLAESPTDPKLVSFSSCNESSLPRHPLALPPVCKSHRPWGLVVSRPVSTSLWQALCPLSHLPVLFLHFVWFCVLYIVLCECLCVQMHQCVEYACTVRHSGERSVSLTLVALMVETRSLHSLKLVS